MSIDIDWNYKKYLQNLIECAIIIFIMMMNLAFYQIDTFSSTAFQGNPIGVISQAMRLSNEEMQNIAEELNLPATVFILPSIELAKTYSRLRQFTVTEEIHYDENAIIACVWLMATNKWFPIPINGSFFYRLELSPEQTIPVEVRSQDNIIQRVMFKGILPSLEPVSRDISSLAMVALGGKFSSLINKSEIMQSKDGGVLIFAMTEAVSLSSIVSNFEAVEMLYNKYHLTCAPFSFEKTTSGLRIKQRFFASSLQKRTRLNTNAAVAASVYLHEQKLFPVKNGKTFIRIEQRTFPEGYGTIFTELLMKKNQLTGIRIGGAATFVMNGELFLPE